MSGDSSKPDIERLLDTDEENSKHSLSNMVAFDPRLPDAFDDVAAMFNTFGRCMDGSQDERPALDRLSEIARELNLSNEDLAQRALGDGDEDDALIVEAKAQMDRLRARQVMDMLSLAVQRHYLWAATDIRRLRRTAAMLYLRVEVEAVGLLCLLRKDPSVAKAWTHMKTEEDGRAFHRQYNRKVLEQLEAVELLSAYNAASGSAQHMRLASLVHGVKVDDGRERRVTTVNLPEWQRDRPHDFLNWLLWFLRTQERVFRALLVAYPDAHDPVFIERVRLLEKLISSLYQTLKDKFPAECAQWAAMGS